MKLNIEYQSQLSDIEVLFHNTEGIEMAINSKLDRLGKGYVKLDELK